jgi:transketolase
MRQTALNLVYELAKHDERVVFIGSDLGAGTLDKFKQEMPDRFLMEGVSEANIVGLAAGMALEGKIPYINTIATFFARRAYEQIVLDLCLHQVKVRLIASGGGLVYAPLGPTHLPIEDISIMRAIPNMTVVAPCDAEEMRRLMLQTLDYPGPIYIRLAKGGDPVVSRPDLPFRIGMAIPLRSGSDIMFISTGICTQVALQAASALELQGLHAGVMHVHTIKPLDTATIKDSMESVPVVVTIEENNVMGGLGSAVAEIIAESGFDPPKQFARIGIPDTFPRQYGSQASLMETFQISPAHLVDKATSLHSQACQRTSR